MVGLEILDGGNWCRGYVFEEGVMEPNRSGVFPLNFCWKIDRVPQTLCNKGVVEKFAKVVHGMSAQLDEEIDLVEGQIVKVTEIIDKDWLRGESQGKSGIFPASFVRIVDSFPGDKPPQTADLSCYLQNPVRNYNDYMNTQHAFKGLDENLKALTPFADAKLPTVPKEIFEDDYFKKNLPASYGSISIPPSENGYDDANSEIFGESVNQCSKGM